MRKTGVYPQSENSGSMLRYECTMPEIPYLVKQSECMAPLTIACGYVNLLT